MFLYLCALPFSGLLFFILDSWYFHTHISSSCISALTFSRSPKYAESKDLISVKLALHSYFCFSPEGSLQCTWLCACLTLPLSVCALTSAPHPLPTSAAVYTWLSESDSSPVAFPDSPVLCFILSVLHSKPPHPHNFHCICVILLLAMRPCLRVIMPPDHESPQQ